MLLLTALLTLFSPAPADSPTFKKHILTTEFISEGVAVADVDRGGRMDVLAGAYWFEVPVWTRHIIDEVSWSGLNLVAEDVTGDGRLDGVVANKEGVFVFEQL